MRTIGAVVRPALFFGLLSSVAPAANAQALDLSQIKCKDFLDSDKERKAVIIAWLDGYYMEQNVAPIMRFDKFAADQQKLTEYCVPNPTLELIEAADKTVK